MFIDTHLIKVGSRLRESYGDEEFEELVQSIEWMGLLQPIVVAPNSDGKFDLIAGENRFRAVLKLHSEGRAIPGVPFNQIKAELQNQLSPETALIIEFEENIRRKDLSYVEKAKYVRRFHDLFTTRTPRWTAEMTAAALKLSKASISYYLNVEQAVKEQPEVAKAITLRAAVKRMKAIEKLEKKKREVAFKATLGDQGVQRANEALVLADARDWIRSVPAESVDLVNFDPPWGDEVSRKSAENWDSFDDSTEVSDDLMRTLLPEIHRILKPDSFCVFWYRQWYYDDALKLTMGQRMIELRVLSRDAYSKTWTRFFEGFDVKFTPTPCIWYKPDKVSDQMRFPEKQLIDAYETFFLLRKGDPVFNEREVQNVFVEPRVPRAQQIHPTEKPVSLMARLVRLCCVPGATVADPCAGSGAILHAAWENHRNPLGCELNEKFYHAALARLAEVMK